MSFLTFYKVLLLLILVFLNFVSTRAQGNGRQNNRRLDLRGGNNKFPDRGDNKELKHRVVVRCRKNKEINCENVIENANNHHQRAKVGEVSKIEMQHFHDSKTKAFTATESEINEISRYSTTIVDSIEYDHERYLLPINENDTEERRRGRSLQEGLYGLAMINADEVHKMGFLGQGVKICLIDSGVDYYHSDFQNSQLSGVEGPMGWRKDKCGHGTHVAGTILDVAPLAELIVVRVFGNKCEWTWSSNIGDAARTCGDHGANIISMSFGGPQNTFAESLVFQDLYNEGILSIAAAGNDGDNSYIYPASYDSVMSVASVTKNGNRADYSQYNEDVDLVAPGSNITSTASGGGFVNKTGTSFSVPHVTGVAALVLSAVPSLSVSQLRNALTSTAVDLGEIGRDDESGHGLVDAIAAVNSVIKSSPLSNDISVGIGIKAGILLLDKKKIKSGQSYIYKGDGAAKNLILKQNTNGKLCLYALQSNRGKFESRTAIWCSNFKSTASDGAVYWSKLQSNGEMKTRDTTSRSTVWSSGIKSNNNKGYQLVMNQDGTLSIYEGTTPSNRGDEIWSEKTSLLS